MAKTNDAGVYQLDNGNWAFRYTLTRDGKKRDVRRAKDLYGNPFKTKREAVGARQIAIQSDLEGRKPAPIIRRTVKEVFQEFCENGRKDRAYQTKLKQDSLWKNHICGKFGNRYVDEISSAEIIDYLSALYYDSGYSYQYTESFLKMFYLIFGQAYSRNYYCGLRINETFGLKWENVDLEKGAITIDRQMQYQNGIIKLVPPKTRNSKRTIYLCPTLLEHLKEKARQRAEDAIKYADVRKQKMRIIDDLDGSKIPSTDLVNCLPNGTIQTLNSFKYPTREIKSKLGIAFKYHYLRHTFGTLMAEMNTPTHLLCTQMGHGNIHITQRYYIALSATGIEVLQRNLKQL